MLTTVPVQHPNTRVQAPRPAAKSGQLRPVSHAASAGTAFRTGARAAAAASSLPLRLLHDTLRRAAKRQPPAHTAAPSTLPRSQRSRPATRRSVRSCSRQKRDYRPATRFRLAQVSFRSASPTAARSAASSDQLVGCRAVFSLILCSCGESESTSLRQSGHGEDDGVRLCGEFHRLRHELCTPSEPTLDACKISNEAPPHDHPGPPRHTTHPRAIAGPPLDEWIMRTKSKRAHREDSLYARSSVRTALRARTCCTGATRQNDQVIPMS